MAEKIEQLRQHYRVNLIENDQYLVIILGQEGRDVISHVVVDTLPKVKKYIGDNKNWRVYGRYDFKENPRLGVIMVLSPETNSLVIPVGIDCSAIDFKGTRALFDTGASNSILKITKARMESLKEMNKGEKPHKVKLADGSEIECYQTNAVISLDDIDVYTTVLCHDRITDTVFGLDHIQRCVVAMLNGRVSIAWAGETA
jgi:predicted aspartyl protease